MAASGSNAAMDSREPVPRVVIPTAAHPIEFFGRQIAFVSTEREHSIRWTELSGYRTSSPQPEWVIVSSGRSLVYHEQESPCNAGVEQRAGTMDKESDLEACTRCKPADFRKAPASTIFEVELDFPKHSVCRNGDEIIAALLENGDKRTRKGQLSQPAQRLLVMMKANDPDLAREFAEARPLQ